MGTENKENLVLNTPNRFTKNKSCVPHFFLLQGAVLVEQGNTVAPV